MSATLRDVFDHFSNRLSSIGSMCVAGGAVRDTLMDRSPKDFDLFLLDIPSGNFNDKRRVITEAVAGLEIVKGLEWHQSEPFLCTTVKWNGVEVQLLANPAPDVEALIATFDWNVCLFAFNGNFVNREKVENIGQGKDLVLQTCTFPLSTLRRGFRFSERFKMRLKRETIVDLSRKIVSYADSKMDIGAVGNEPDMPSLEANTLIA